MKKEIIISSLAASFILSIPVQAYDDEILFREIPWTTTYEEAQKLMPDNNFYPIYGEDKKKYPVDDVLYGDYTGKQPDNSGMNIIDCVTPQIEVAGYTTSSIDMYFIFDVVDGELDFEVGHAKLYGATYEFESENVELMSDDLLNKLISIYGNPDSTSNKEGWSGNKYTYTHWSGANDTELVLKTEDRKDNSTFKDSIYISYAWRGGDDLLFQASDIMGGLNVKAEAEKYGSSDVSGL